MIPTQPPAIVKRMIDAALKAAHISLLRRRQGVNVKEKRDGSKVTAGDYQSQQIIEAELRALSPALEQLLGVDAVGFVMEETLNKRHIPATRANWVVDPIDGTIGYSRKLGEKAEPWAVSIALVVDGKTVAAVVYEAAGHEYGTSAADFAAIDPNRPQGRIFWAAKEIKHAYCLKGSDAEFEVVPLEANENYAQRIVALEEGNELPILLNIPKLRTSVDHRKQVRLDNSTRIRPGAKVLIDAANRKEIIERAGLKDKEVEACYSAVAGAMRAADGRARAFIATRCREWDTAAASLILEKSRVPYSRHARTIAQKEAA